MHIKVKPQLLVVHFLWIDDFAEALNETSTPKAQ